MTQKKSKSKTFQKGTAVNTYLSWVQRTVGNSLNTKDKMLITITRIEDRKEEK